MKLISSALENRWIRAQNFQLDFGFFQNKIILEVGAGGFGMVYFVDQQCSKVAVDPLCHNYKDIFAGRNIMTYTHIVTGVGEYLPFEDNSFDMVLCFNIIDHGMNPSGIIKELSRVLKPEGNILLMVNTFDIHKSIRSKLHLIDKPHPHHLHDAEVIQFIKDSELEIDYHIIRKSEINLVKSYIKGRNIYPALANSLAMLFGIRHSYYVCSNRSDIK